MSAYKEGQLENASKIIGELLSRRLDDRSRRKIEKILLLLLYGELYGMNSLNKLLSSYGLSGNDYYPVWRNLSCGTLVACLNRWLWYLFAVDFVKRLGQSGSTWSRQRMTLVIDGSIFKQWLQGEEFGKYFAKYYSGQYGKAVHGLNVLLCGMCIGEIFYPLHFRLRRKEEKDPATAADMLKKVYHKLMAIASEHGQQMGQLYLSVDSGFRSKQLVNYCGAAGIIYIGVPKVNHIVFMDGKKLNIGDLKKEFKQREARHKLENPTSEKEFTWRVRVHYNALDRPVTLLFFRVNKSKKVSVIFSPNLDVKAKTMRHQWFERTKIELLFRMLKTDFKIQQATIHNRLGFMKKLALALVKSVYAQQLTQIVKKIDVQFRRIGYAGIKQLLIFHQIGKEWLDELVFS